MTGDESALAERLAQPRALPREGEPERGDVRPEREFGCARYSVKNSGIGASTRSSISSFQ